MEARITRHFSKLKRLRWHIDYLLGLHATIVGVELFDREECVVNQDIEGDILVPGFGSTDCRSKCGSHLKYLGQTVRRQYENQAMAPSSSQGDFQVLSKNILVTGLPGSGKTTLIEKTVARLNFPVAGFITREIRERGNRLGFSIDTFDGQSGVLAHVDFKSKYRVGRYGVRIETIDKIAVSSLNPSATDVLIVIDEIGKMECFSEAFRKVIVEVLNSPNRVLATIALKGDSFIQSLKSREDVSVIELNQANRETLFSSLIDAMRWSQVE